MAFNETCQKTERAGDVSDVALRTLLFVVKNKPQTVEKTNKKTETPFTKLPRMKCISEEASPPLIFENWESIDFNSKQKKSIRNFKKFFF